MATIITVHGTNATGPEEGQAWWQKGSEFECDARRYIESDDGSAIEFKPFVWDGRNSETSRRAAGWRLFQLLTKADTASKPHVLVGHSHGGSVIAAALLWSAARRRHLPSLARWLTVGTPFVEMRQSMFLFSRLPLVWKSVYAVLAACLLGSLFFVSEMLFGFVQELQSGSGDAAIVLLVVLLLTLALLVGLAPFAVLHFGQLYVMRRALPMYHKKSLVSCDRLYSGVWISLSHRNDEAVHGLKSLSGADYVIFPRDFAVPTISSLSILVVPALLVLIALSDHIYNWLDSSLPGKAYEPASTWATRLFSLMVMPARLIDRKLLDESIAGFLGPVLLLVPTLMCVALISWLARPISALLSRQLNRGTWTQIRQTGGGGDTHGEYFSGIRQAPTWGSRAGIPLPAELEAELSSISDRHAAASIAKLRSRLAEIALPRPNGERTSVAEDFLTWGELIHTSYFVVPRFRKLVCCAIAHSPGFKPTEEFKRDPDYPLMLRWLEEIRPKQSIDVAPVTQ